MIAPWLLGADQWSNAESYSFCCLRFSDSHTVDSSAESQSRCSISHGWVRGIRSEILRHQLILDVTD